MGFNSAFKGLIDYVCVVFNLIYYFIILYHYIGVRCNHVLQKKTILIFVRVGMERNIYAPWQDFCCIFSVV